MPELALQARVRRFLGWRKLGFITGKVPALSPSDEARTRTKHIVAARVVI